VEVEVEVVVAAAARAARRISDMKTGVLCFHFLFFFFFFFFLLACLIANKRCIVHTEFTI